MMFYQFKMEAHEELFLRFLKDQIFQNCDQ